MGAGVIDNEVFTPNPEYGYGTSPWYGYLQSRIGGHGRCLTQLPHLQFVFLRSFDHLGHSKGPSICVHGPWNGVRSLGSNSSRVNFQSPCSQRISPL